MSLLPHALHKFARLRRLRLLFLREELSLTLLPHSAWKQCLASLPRLLIIQPDTKSLVPAERFPIIFAGTCDAMPLRRVVRCGRLVSTEVSVHWIEASC